MASATFGKRKSSLPSGGQSGFGKAAYAVTGSAPTVPGYNYSPAPSAPAVTSVPSFTRAEPVKLLRFVSAGIDTVVMFAMFLGLVWLVADPAINSEEVNQAEAITILAMLIVPGLLYGTLMEASPLQGTLGKVLTGTRVTDMDGTRISFGRAVGRNLGKLLSGLVPFYIPYFMVFFTAQNQSLHDKMAGTLVFKKGEGPASTVAQVFE